MINNSSTLIHCICERFSAKKDVAAAFVWLHYRLEEGQECSTQKINSYFEQANLPKYNVTYLKEDLRKHRNILSIKGGGYKPTRTLLLELDAEFNQFLLKTEEVVCEGLILPTSLYENTRGYIETLGKQINASYEHNIYDESNLLAERDSSAYVLHLRAESMGQVYDNTEIMHVIDAYLDIQKRYPNDYLSAAKLGNIYVAGHQYEDAINITEKYRSIDSTNVLVNRINAQAYCLNKDYPKAIERYEQLLQEKDSSFQTCFYAGISYYALEDFYPAHDLLERALKDDNTNINVLYYLGRACSKTSWKEDGVTYLETAVSLAMPSDSVMSRLYVGLADCYKMAFQYTDQANTLLTQYEKYDRQKHKLLYDAAFIYYYYLKDASKAERYLTAYLKTRPKNSKDKVQEVDADGVPIIGEDNRYNAAENWLKDIREKRKKEDFFKGKVDTASVTPIK